MCRSWASRARRPTSPTRRASSPPPARPSRSERGKEHGRRMPRPISLPDQGEGLTEAEIVKVLVNEGDVLAEDAPLLEVETDKATVEIPSPFAGRVARIHVRPGQSVKVGDVLVTFEDAAEASGGRRGLVEERERCR